MRLRAYEECLEGIVLREGDNRLVLQTADPVTLHPGDYAEYHFRPVVGSWGVVTIYHASVAGRWRTRLRAWREGRPPGPHLSVRARVEGAIERTKEDAVSSRPWEDD